MPNVEYLQIGIDDIYLVKPLWEKLRLLHMKISSFFPERPAGLIFEERIKELIQKSRTGKFRIDLAKEKDKINYIGYCISSISDKNEGEIDSIYIESEFRGQRLGDKFMKSALSWMEEFKVEKISINVMYGNDRALPFYAKYGFYPRNLILHKK